MRKLHFILIASATCSLILLACGPATSGPPVTPTLIVIPETAQPTAGTGVTPPTTEAALQATATPPPAPVLYRVAFVKEDDTLNVRSEPGVENAVVTELAFDSSEIVMTGPGQETSDGSFWVPIDHYGDTGWVNRYYLTEQVDPSVFCAEGEAAAIVERLKRAVTARDNAMMALLVHPERGLLIRLAWWNEEMRLTAEEAGVFFTDATERNWGISIGGGDPVVGTAAEVVVPMLERDLLGGEVQTGCGEILHGGTPGLITLPPEYLAVNFYSVYRQSAENELDWGTWVVGIEYWNGIPWLAYLVHYQWEP